MAYTFPQLKEIRDNITKEYNVTMEQAARVVAFYNVGQNKDHDKIDLMMMGDLSPVPAALSALGISSDINQAENREEKNAKTSAKKRSKSPVKNTSQTDNKQAPESVPSSFLGVSAPVVDKNPVDNIKNRTNGKINPLQVHDDIIPAMDAEIIQELDELPEGFADTVREWLEDWATFEKIDLNKLHAQQWRALCMYVGQKIKKYHVLDDTEKIKARGGRFYKPQKLDALLTLWGYFCGVYRQVPLVYDFVSFSGVSRSYFYDYDGKGLSSTSVHILQKAKAMEESGLGSSVAGGGAGVVGGIFLLKARHGYSETVTIQHTTAAPSVGLSELPKLTDHG